MKKVTGLLSLIIKGELNEIPLSKLDFNFDYDFIDSLKNVFCRWFLKDMNSEDFSAVMEKVGQKNDLSNWLQFERCQLFDDFNVDFKTDVQYNHFFSVMPFQIIQKYRKFIVDESSIPIYYYKKLSLYPKEEEKGEKNPVKQFLTKKKKKKENSNVSLNNFLLIIIIITLFQIQKIESFHLNRFLIPMKR